MLAREEFEGAHTAGYLDTATYGLPPRSTVAALQRALHGWQEWEDWRVWEADGEACRAAFARIIGGRTDEVALVPAVSASAGIVAASLRAGPGDNVVCYEHEFRSCLYPFMALEQRGVELRLAPLDELAARCDERTALVAVSAVQSADGRVADLAGLRATGARVFVDGTQAIGALPVDLSCIDFLAVAGYKWLLSPRGLAFLWIRPERLDEIEPWLAGWKSSPDAYDSYYGPPRQLTQSARRLDTSLAWHLAAGSRASLSLIAELGIERIAAHNLALVRRFCAELGLEESGSAIVRIRGSEDDVASLRKAGVKCAGRAGAVRLSFHLYNDGADVDRALEALARRQVV